MTEHTGRNGHTDQYVIFTVAGTFYALPSAQIAHVEMIEHITRVPNAPAFVDGVMFSRGNVVPAVNLRARFGFDRVPYDARTRLLVVQVDGRTVGLVVDAAREFVTFPEGLIRPPSEALVGMSGRYLRGIVTTDDRMVLILDLREVLDPEDVAAVVAARPAVPLAQEVQ
jgi:purine-binding chemotaxis protein CheW